MDSKNWWYAVSFSPAVAVVVVDSGRHSSIYQKKGNPKQIV